MNFSSMEPSPSSSTTAPAWILSTRQSLRGTACSGVGPPWGHRSYQKTCTVWAPLHKLQFPPGAYSSVAHHGLRLHSGHVHLLWWEVLHRLQNGYLLWHGPSRAAREQPASPWASPGASPWPAGESLLWHLEHLPRLQY